MPVATIISTSNRHNPTQVYASHPPRYKAYEGTSNSTVSDSSQSVEKLTVGGERRVRTEVYGSPSKEHRSRAKGAMTSQYLRRTYSDARTSAKETYVKEPRVVVQEVRRKSDSEHRHHHRRSEKEDARESEGVRVYRTHRKSEGEADRSRHSTVRRSTTSTREASRTRHERQRTEDREVRRRHSERKQSHHEEKAHTALRHEKRSIADHAPKSTKDRAPVTR